MKFLHKFRHKDGKEGRSLLKKFLIFSATILLIGFIGIFLFFMWILDSLPTMKEIKNYEAPEASTIYDRNLNVLYTVHGKENRKIVPFDKIKNDTIYAVVALEDANFFEHKGVDFYGVIRAVLGQLRIMEYKGGGSTLTQQFVKNKFLSNERTVLRKIKEMILSAQIESYYSKEEIVTMYLNQIPFGANIYGIEQASKQFFGKTSDTLTLAESAIIASIPNATTYYSPYGTNRRTKINNEEILLELEKKGINSYEKLIDTYGEKIITYGLLPRQIMLNSGTVVFYLPGRSSYALENMLKKGFITEDAKNMAINEMYNYEFKEFREDIKAPHFVMFVKQLVEEKYGENALSEGGLKIVTTLDLELQNKAEEMLSKNALTNNENAENQALLTVDTSSGQILTMVGSRDFFDKQIDGQVNVTIQKRLAGSTFKPIAYTSMLLAGYSPSTVIFDVKTDFGENGKEYIPKNFDNKFMGPISMRTALGHSRNIPAIKAGIVGGIQKMYDIAESLGIKMYKNAEWYGASMAIGTAEVTGKELLEAYLVFANNGKKITTKPILKILNKEGVVLEELKEEINPPVVLDPETAYLVTDMLSDDAARGPGWNSRLQLKGRKNAAKTGTSNKLVIEKGKKEPKVLPLDGWAIGYTPQYTTVVWAGNNNGSPMAPSASGWGTAAKTWHEYMSWLHQGKPVLEFAKPAGIKYFKIVSLSGKLPKEDTPESLIKTGIFSSINIPKEYDDSISFVEIDKISKKLVTSYTPEDAITKAAILNLHSLKPDLNKWEKPVKEWLEKSGSEFLKTSGINDVLAEAPQEFDNIHTRDNTISKPKIEITSPKKGDEVSKNGFSIVPKISSDNLIQKVEFYLDGTLIDTVYDFPYKGTIKPESQLIIGSTHEVKIKAFDDLYNVGSSTIQIVIGDDNTPPFVEIVKPVNNQEIIAGSTYEIRTLAYDVGSDIKKLTFYLNDNEIGHKTSSPFSLLFKVPETEGSSTLKVVAIDKAGNESSNSISFESKIKEETGVIDPIIKIDGKIIAGTPTEIQALIPKGEIGKIVKIELITRYKTVTQEDNDAVVSTINDFKGNTNGVLYLTWQSPQKGEYQVYIKEYYENRKVLKSAKISVVVE